MYKTVETFKAWLHTTLQKNNAVQGEATIETLRYYRIFAVILLIVNVAYTIEFWFHFTGAESPAQVRWATAIGWTHFTMGLTSLVFILLLYRFFRRSERNQVVASILQILFCASCLLFAIALSVVDQLVATNTTLFAMISLLVAISSLMRPAITVLIFLLCYMAFFKALEITQPDTQLLNMARSHGLGAVLMSVVASIVVWRNYVASVLLRRELVGVNQALAKNQAELAHLATRDFLTGLYTRREFLRLAEIEMARAARGPTDTCLLMLDLDFFKQVNDRFGHPVGDEVLTQVAAILTNALRVSDLVGRMGGEEFIVLLPNTSRGDAIVVADNLRKKIKEHALHVNGVSIPVTVSIGVSGFDRDNLVSLDRLYAVADRALYAAKELGRDRVEYVDADASQEGGEDCLRFARKDVSG